VGKPVRTNPLGASRLLSLCAAPFAKGELDRR